MSRDADSWSLERQGYPSPLFILQRHLPVIRVGRSAVGVQLQCLAVHISRQHFEFRRRIESDGKIYWSIYDVGSSSKTFVNGYPIPQHQEIGLNDRDLISVGTKDSAVSAKDKKDVFVYMIRAPTNWSSNTDPNESEDAGNEEAVREDAATPPPSPSSISPPPRQYQDLLPPQGQQPEPDVEQPQQPHLQQPAQQLQHLQKPNTVFNQVGRERQTSPDLELRSAIEVKKEKSWSQKVAPKETSTRKEPSKTGKKSRDNDAQQMNTIQRGSSSSSSTTSNLKETKQKISASSRLNSFSSDDENDFRSKGNRVEISNQEKRDSHSSSSDEISTRCSQEKVLAAKRNRITSSFSDEELFPSNDWKKIFSRYYGEKYKLQAMSKQRLMTVIIKKVNVPSIKKCTGAKLSRDNKIVSWVYKRSERSSKDSVSSKSDGKSRHLSSSSTASKKSSSSKSSKSSRSLSGVNRERHSSTNSVKRRDSASSLSGQIKCLKPSTSDPIQSSSEPSSKSDSDATTLKSNPSKCQDSATTISGTKQHDQTPQVRGSNSHTSHKCTPESTDTISNQKYSNLPLYGEKRAASLSLSDRDGEMSDDSVSILDDNFQTKQTTVLSRDHKRRKIEVKEEAHSQLEYPDPNFVEASQCPILPTVTSSLKSETPIIRTSTIEKENRSACQDFFTQESIESPIQKVVDLDEDISIISNDFDGPCNFSQIEEVILIDSDVEEDYYSQRLSQEVLIKQETEVTGSTADNQAADDQAADESEFDFDLEFDKEFDLQKSDSDDDVICLDGDELELNQMPLFQKMLTKIKKEKLEESTQDITASSQPRSPPPEMSRQEIENEEEGEIVDTDAPQSRLDAGVIGADEISSDSDNFYELPSPTPSRATGSISGESSRSVSESEKEDLAGLTGESEGVVDQQVNLLAAATTRDMREKVKDFLDSESEDEETGISEQTNPPEAVPSSADDQFRQVADKEPKTAKLIHALPQPHRRAFLRGISLDMTKKLEAKKTEASKEIPAERASRTSFGKVVRVRNRQTAAQMKEDRKQKLKDLAKKDQDAKEKSTAPTSIATKLHTSKVKQSIPKVAMLADIDIFAKTRDALPLTKATLAKPMPSSFASSKSAVGMAPPVNKVGPRMVAETKVVDNGYHRVVKKMTFNNMITNVASQSLADIPLPVAAVKPLEYRCLPPEPVSTGNKKTVRWKDQAKTGILVEIREIPLEGKGFKVRNGQKECPPQPGERPPSLSSSSAMTSTVETSGQAASLKQGDSNTKCQSYDDILAQILRWHTRWLQEQEKQKDEPPVEGPGCKLNHVPSVFSGISDYCRTFYPLMLHDIWASVFKDYLCTKNQGREILACVISVNIRPKSDIFDLSVYGLMTNEDGGWQDFGPGDGWLVRLDLRFAPEDGLSKGAIKPCFGFVECFRVYQRSSKESPYDKGLLEASPANRKSRLTKSFDMKIAIKRLTSRLDYQKPILIAAVSRIRPSLRLIKAVDNVMGSPLFQPILKPDISTFYTDIGHTEIIAPDIASLPFMAGINSEQKRVVLSCSRLCTTNMDKPHIALIQGPPGTGKSTTIAAMIAQLFSRWSASNLPNTPYPRILLTAPSNAAVDELVIKLMGVRAQLPGNKQFNMMRVGPEGSVHPKVKTILFENLLKEHIRKESCLGSNYQSVELEIAQRKNRLHSLGDQLSKEPDEGKRNLLTRKIREEDDLLKRAKSALGPKSLSEKDLFRIRSEGTDNYFGHADIIATTLTSSMNGHMERFFVNKDSYRATARNSRSFSICIVDEASQCVEPEMLIPFRLGFTKLVMVGDPEQLPATVSSVKAKDLSYGESMFKRLYKFFDGQPEKENPVLKLRVQYRMHPEIVKWPNHYFYGGILRQGSQNRYLPLFNFALFNLAQSTQIGGDSISNEEEADFVVKLAKLVQIEIDRSGEGHKSIGVITFYSKQRALIARKLSELGSNQIDVKTVDGFQGSECDVVIISCVRSQTQRNSIGFVAGEQRLNVALTRAKFALYVVGNFDVLKLNPMWRNLVEDAERRKRIKNVTKYSVSRSLICSR